MIRMGMIEILLLLAAFAVFFRVTKGKSLIQTKGLKRFGKRLSKSLTHRPWVWVCLLICFVVFPTTMLKMLLYISCGMFALAMIGVISGGESSGSQLDAGVDDKAPVPNCCEKDKVVSLEKAVPAVDAAPPRPHGTVYARPEIRKPAPLRVSEYPERPLGRFGLLMHTFAMLALLSMGCMVVGITVSTTRPMRSHVHSPEPVYAQAIHYVSDAATQNVPRPVTSEDYETLRVPEIQPGDMQDGPYFFGPGEHLDVSLSSDQPAVTLHSEWRADEQDALRDLDGVLTEFSREVVRLKLGVDAEDWSPSRSWIRSNFSNVQTKADPKGHPDILLKRAEIRVDLNQSQIVELIVDRYRADQYSHRAIRLGQVYLGSVLIVGGLAIFLRLGTGRRPGVRPL